MGRLQDATEILESVASKEPCNKPFEDSKCCNTKDSLMQNASDVLHVLVEFLEFSPEGGAVNTQLPGCLELVSPVFS